jgi:hypothetical protein
MPSGRGPLLLRATSRGLDPADLLPGRDAVIDLSIEQGVSLPRGILIDDHLDLPARQDVDRLAHEMLAAWRRQVDRALTIDSLCLSDLWQSELYADVFLPVSRIMAGVKATVAAYGVRDVECHGLDDELVAALGSELTSVAVRSRAPGPPPTYPSEEAVRPGIPARRSRLQRILRRTVDTVGLPTIAYGDVLVIQYRSTLPVLNRLVEVDGPRPVLDTSALPDVALALRAARRGGWVGRPGYRARRRSRVEAGRAIASAAAPRPELDGPGMMRMAHIRALGCLRGRALETTAIVPSLQRLLGRRLRAIALPFDHEPLPKTIIRLAQSAGVPTLYVQHGYEPYRVFHTGTLTDFAAVWSPADRAAFPTELRSRVRVVGNPGLRASLALNAQPPRGADRRPVAVVLAEHYARQSAILDRRITAVHLAAAIQGLRASSHDWHIVVRPHPSDDVAEFVRLVGALGARGVDVDGLSAAGNLLSCADLCVGALSTMTLEAALMGLRVVMLNPEAINWSPPLQLCGPVPCARNATELARMVDQVMNERVIPGARELSEALGAGPRDPACQVVEWLREIVAGRG